MKLVLTILFFFGFFIFIPQSKTQIYSPFTDGNILFYDDFENNASNWYTGKLNDAFCDINKSMLRMYNYSYTNSWAQWRTFYLNPENEFSIEISIRQFSGSSTSNFGIIWGSTGWDKLNCFAINSNGSFKIFKIENNNYTEIKKKDESTAVFPKFYDNILNISYRNDTTFFFLNGQIVFLKKGLELFGPECGIYIDGYNKIKVDYIKIIHPEYSKNVTAYPVTRKEIEKIDIKKSEKQIICNPIYHTATKRLYISVLNSDNNFDIYFSEKKISGEFSIIRPFDTLFNNKSNNSVVNTFDDGEFLLLNGVYLNDTSKLSGISYSQFKDSAWTKPTEILIENIYNLDTNSQYSISYDKKYLLSTLRKLNGKGQKDIYVSFLNDKGYYSEPVNLGDSINSYGDENSVFLCSDNETIFFSTNSLPGFGGYDIFVSQRLDDTWTNWSKPQNLGPVINSAANETYFFIDSDKLYGFYISDIEENTNLYQFFVFDAFFKHLK